MSDRAGAGGGEEASIPFVHPVYMRIVLDCLGSRGVRPSAVLERTGLRWQALGDEQPPVDFAVFRRFVAHAIEASGERALGLLAGAMFQPYHTPVGIAAVSGDTLGQGLQVLARHARLVFGGMDFSLENSLRWSILKVKPLRPLGEMHVFVTQSILGACRGLFEAILGRSVDELAVGLPYPRPADDESSPRYVRDLMFDQPYLSFQLPLKLLNAPSIAADPKAFMDASQACLRMESEQRRGGFVQRARQALLERLPRNPDVSELAAALDVSARTLVRRLVDAGVTYSDLKDELRKSHAVWYLQHTELSIESIAAQLGYADPASFGRKFKVWYRVTPGRMRKESRGGIG
jgi:AraC-like DNA-binding protein